MPSSVGRHGKGFGVKRRVTRGCRSTNKEEASLLVGATESERLPLLSSASRRMYGAMDLDIITYVDVPPGTCAGMQSKWTANNLLESLDLERCRSSLEVTPRGAPYADRLTALGLALRGFRG